MASVTFTVKLTADAALEGVPVIAPVLLFKDAHEGNEPLLIEKANGAVPPVVAMV